MITKAPSKTGRFARVTFRLPADGVEGAQKVDLLGEFNDWKPGAHPMKRRKDGGFSATVSLAAGRSYRFRYLADGGRWLNDPDADDQVYNRFGTQDSVVQV